MRKNKFKHITKAFALIMCLPIIYLTAVVTLPFIEPIFKEVTIISAGLSFLEGGKSIFMNEIDDDFDGEVDINDTEMLPYEDYNDSDIAKPSSDSTTSTVSSEITTPQNSGIIKRQTYTAGATAIYIPLKNGFIKNCTSLKADKILAAVNSKPKFKITANNKPEVLIMHTHETESYQNEKSDFFSKNYNSRTTDNRKNVSRVGDEIEKQLKAAGIGVIHDRTPHDYPSYNGAYERSAVTVKNILKKYPTIKVVLDVHRDAIQPNADTMIAPVTTINGRSCAQVMIISGCDNGKMNMPKYMENLKFSASLQSQMESDYKTLTRPILFDYRKYNQNLTTGSILLEMGGHANTLDEAIYAGELVGKSLVKTLKSLK